MRNSLLVDTMGELVGTVDLYPGSEWFYMPIPPDALAIPILDTTEARRPLPTLQTRAFRYEGTDGWGRRVYVEQPKALPPALDAGCAS